MWQNTCAKRTCKNMEKHTCTLHRHIQAGYPACAITRLSTVYFLEIVYYKYPFQLNGTPNLYFLLEILGYFRHTAVDTQLYTGYIYIYIYSYRDIYLTGLYMGKLCMLLWRKCVIYYNNYYIIVSSTRYSFYQSSILLLAHFMKR